MEPVPLAFGLNAEGFFRPLILWAEVSQKL